MRCYTTPTLTVQIQDANVWEPGVYGWSAFKTGGTA